MNELTEVDRAYLGGLFSGEGCISAHTHDGRSTAGDKCVSVTLIVAGIDRPLIESIRELTGIGSVHLTTPKKGYRNIWRWQLYGKENVKNFLIAILPWIRESNKRLQAKAMISLCGVNGRGRSAERQEFSTEIKRLKSA